MQAQNFGAESYWFGRAAIHENKVVCRSLDKKTAALSTDGRAVRKLPPGQWAFGRWRSRQVWEATGQRQKWGMELLRAAGLLLYVSEYSRSFMFYFVESFPACEVGQGFYSQGLYYVEVCFLYTQFVEWVFLIINKS